MKRKTWKRKVLTLMLALAMVLGSVNTTAFVSYAAEAIVFEELETVLYRSQDYGQWGSDSNAVMTFDGTTATVTADSFGAAGGWNLQWQNIAVSSEAESNILSFDVVSTIDKIINVKNETTTEMITVTLVANEPQTVQIGGGSTAVFVMDLGGGDGAGTLTFSNMTYEEGSLEPVIPDDGSDDTLFAAGEALNFEEITTEVYNSETDGDWAGVDNAQFTYTGTTAVVSADNFGTGKWGLQWRMKDLTSASTANVFEFEVTSNTDRTIMFKDGEEGTEHTLTLTAGQRKRFAYAVEGNTFTAVFDLVNGAAGTLTFTNAKFGPNMNIEEAPAVAPAQASDKENGYRVGEAVVLNVTDGAAWAEAITSVVVNNKTVAAENYTVDAGAGTITIAADVFTKQNVYEIEIEATGYEGVALSVPVYATSVDSEDWQIKWNDEFEGTELDETKWSYEIGVQSGEDYAAGNNAPIHWGNDEKQYYIEEAVSVADGYLTITGDTLDNDTKTQYGITDNHVQYKSGRIRTVTDAGEVLGATTYGRIEAAIAMPVSDGYWPAFWMLPTPETTQYYGGWPSSGEIDIMEVVGQRLGDVDGTIHYGGDWTQHVYSGGQFHFEEGTTVETEHVYAVEWEPGEIRWYVDDVLYHIENNWYGSDATGQKYSYPAPFDEDFYILLNLAMSGNYVSNVDPTVMGGQMKVDYVRILMDENFDYDVEVTEPAAVEKDTEFFTANGGYTDLIVDKDYETLMENIYGDGGMLTPGNLKWWAATNDGAGAASEVSVVDGAAKINVTAVGANDYNVQLMQNFPLAQGYTYRVTFDAWTDVSTGRTITVVPGSDCNHGWVKYGSQIIAELGTSSKTFTFDFTMAKESDPSARLEMNLGGSTGTVYIDNVSVIALTDEQLEAGNAGGTKEPLANGEYVYNGTFDKGTGKLGDWTVEGAEGSTANRDYTVTVGNEETKLIQTGLLITEYDDYVLSFDAKTLGAGKVHVALTDESGELGYVTTEFELDAALDTYTLNFSVPEDAGTDKGTLTFTFIGEGETITIDNVSMKRLTNAGVAWDEYEIFPMGKGTDALTGWSTYDEVWTWATNAITAKELGNGEVGFEVETTPADQAYKVMLQKGDIALAKGMTYTIRYAVKASADAQPVSISLEDSSYNACYKKSLTVGTEWTYVEETFTPEALGTRALKFLLAGVSQDCYMYVKDVEIQLDAPRPQFKEGKEVSAMKKGESFRLDFEHDRKVQDKFNTFTYTTEDTDIITLDTEGNITAKAAGEATIVVTSAIGTEYVFTVTVTADEVVNPFGDVNETDWFYPYVMFAYKYELMGGKGEMPDGTLKFDPSNTITRAEFVTMLYAKENKPAVEYVDTFTDVADDKWYTDAILWAAEEEIVGGKKVDYFDANGMITRQEIALILYKYALYKEYDVSETENADLSGFADAASVSNWAETGMKWAVEYQVIGGKTENGQTVLSPGGNAIRAEAATMLKAFMGAFEGITE